MIKLNDVEAIFLPEEQDAEMEDWLTDMESQGLAVWDRYAPICLWLRMVPIEIVNMRTEIYQMRDLIKDIQRQLMIQEDLNTLTPNVKQRQ